MAEDVVERLRLMERKGYGPIGFMGACREAADEIERLRAELARRSPSPDAEAARREAIEEAAKVADAYAARMRTSAEKPHPITGRENIIAICKADAGESLAKAIRALSPPVEGE